MLTHIRHEVENGLNEYIHSTIRFIIVRHRYATMLLRAIMDKADIEKYYKKLEEQLRNAGKRIGGLDLGGRQETFIKYQLPQGIWWQYREESKDRRTVHMNRFGLDEPSSSKPREICQMNFYAPLNFNNQPSAFAEDKKTGKVYVIHSGYLCWTKQKEGKILFRGSFEAAGQLVPVEWKNKSLEMICVSSLDDRSLIHNLANFVKEADKVEKKVGPIREAEEEQELAYAEKEIQDEGVSISEARARLKVLTQETEEYVTIRGKRRKRNSYMTALIKRVRGDRCQICRKSIKKKDCSWYVEAAHIKPKNEGGGENPDNIMILCPNHHKEFDLGDVKIVQRGEKRIKFVMNEIEYTVKLGI